MEFDAFHGGFDPRREHRYVVYVWRHLILFMNGIREAVAERYITALAEFLLFAAQQNRILDNKSNEQISFETKAYSTLMPAN